MAGEALTMIEEDLGTVLESDFGAPVVLVDPEGNVIDTSVHGGKLYGRVQYDYVAEQPSGERVIVKQPMVILRKSSLSRVPQAGENWAIRIPTSPGGSEMTTFKLGATRAPEEADTIGFVRLFPQKAVQS